MTIAARIVAALLLVTPCLAAPEQSVEPANVAEAPARRMLLDGDYPIEVSVSFSAALFHWLDSLTGLQAPGVSAGKTVQAHRETYDRMFGGAPRGEASALLRRFGEIRRGFVERRLSEPRLTDDPEDGPNALLVAFLEEPDLESALARAREHLPAGEHRELRAILEHFAPKYEKVWQDGKIPERFLQAFARSPRKQELEALLVRLARFFGVDPRRGEHPHVILAPVRSGYGTHAQANGRHLLIELRWQDELESTASVIVHENAHLLMHRIESERMRRLERHIERTGALEAGSVLREALPTALGQGVADRAFRKGWSTSQRWYHRPEVDDYAKRIFPTVYRALAGDGRFDETLLVELLELYPRRPAGRPTPRSP